MIAQIKLKWKEDISQAWLRSQEPSRLVEFKEFNNKKQIVRASFFSEMSEVIGRLGRF